MALRSFGVAKPLTAYRGTGAAPASTNYYAGYLIDTAGLKGYQVGNVRISEKHANFFVSDGDATAEDIRALIAEAWHRVRGQFGVEMELEVELVGDWKFSE